MKKYLYSAALVCISAMICGCGDDNGKEQYIQVKGEGEACASTAECGQSLICSNGICLSDSDPCAYITCGPGIACHDGVCDGDMIEDKTCNGIVCKANELCVDKVCKPKCGNIVCKDNESCAMGACQEKCGDRVCGRSESCIDGECIDNTGVECGDVRCKSTQTCVDDVCRDLGNCGGYACLTGEVCFEAQCRLQGDCGGVLCDEETEWCSNQYCLPRVLCGQTLCEGGQTCEDGTCVESRLCDNGSLKCNGICCGNSEFCSPKGICCEFKEACGDGCCAEDEVCEYEQCRKKCDDNVVRCVVDGVDVCCAEGEICTANQCFEPSTTECVDNYMCDNGQYCDSATKTCLPQPGGDACMMTPTGGEVLPTLVWYWGETAPATHPNHVQVMSAPMVADMNNDTIPEVIFNSFSSSGYNGNGILRILNGQTGALIASSDGTPMTDGGSQVAVGDVDGDTIPEIVTCSNEYKLIVYDFDPKTNKLSVKWKSQNARRECGQAGPGIADFNGDGKPEVYVRYNIHDGATGELLGSEACGTSDNLYQHAPCDYTVAADIDGDGQLELVGGNVAYKLDVKNKKMSKYYDRSGDGHIDGYPAIADINLDGKPEIVVIRSNNNTVMAFNADGSNHWAQPLAHSAASGGPATIANITGDSHPEITFAGKYAYVAIDYTGKIIWTRTTRDYSSAKTGSSVFDFDGDGKAEVVYADEYFLRVYNGNNGNTVYCQCNTSGTHWEYPVIADVNADGHAEIIISSNNSMISGCPSSLSEEQGKDACVDALMKKGGDALKGTHGVRAFASPTNDWVATRKIYNQHAYSVTNVSDNGTIPTHQRANWTTQGLNNFRLNVQPGANYLPNLKIDRVSTGIQCNEEKVFYFTVENIGWATAKAGITVNIYSINGSETKLEGSVKTTKDIRASESETLSFTLNADGRRLSNMTIIFSFGDNLPTMCSTDDKSVRHSIVCPVN